jgi:HD superfamily phosphodiesterase
MDRIDIVKKLAFKALHVDSPELDYEAGMVHLAGVAYLGAFLAANRNLNPELCICAGLLHDIWLFQNMGSPDIFDEYVKHGHYGSELAEELLKGTGLYRDEEIEIICRMIHNHNDKSIAQDDYSEVLKDADALQHYLNNTEYDKTRYNYHGRIEKLIGQNV